VTGYRIQLTIDYEPVLEHYPDFVKSKAQAMAYDIESVLYGEMSVDDLISFSDDVIYGIHEVEESEGL